MASNDTWITLFKQKMILTTYKSQVPSHAIRSDHGPVSQVDIVAQHYPLLQLALKSITLGEYVVFMLSLMTAQPAELCPLCLGVAVCKSITPGLSMSIG